MLPTKLDLLMNCFTHLVKPEINIRIREAQDFQSILLQNQTSLFVVAQTLFGVVLRAVQLNYQTCIRAVEIYDKRFNDSLFVDLYGILPQEHIPKFSFLRGHLPPELPGSVQHFVVFDYRCLFHKLNLPVSGLTLSVTAYAVPPLPK